MCQPYKYKCVFQVKTGYYFIHEKYHVLHKKVLSGFLQVLVTLSGPSAYTNPLLQSSKCKT